jgi:Cdc6-like AAA superfamily ATPase
MTALLPGTFFIGREELKAGIAQALRHPRSVGALLVGGPGVGKTALLQHCLRGEAGFHIVHVRGSASSQDLPYRALSFLLSELEPETLEHPVMVLQALTGVLHQHAEGKPLIIAVDNAEHLDPFSSALISQLVLSDTVRVVLAVKDFAGQTAPSWRCGATDPCAGSMFRR